MTGDEGGPGAGGFSPEAFGLRPRRPLEGLPLEEPRYKEEVVGTLNDEEAALFDELYHATGELEVARREVVADVFASNAALMRRADPSKGLHDLMREMSTGEVFRDDAAARDYFRLEQRAAELFHRFHWTLGERFGLHHWRLGVRSRARVVRIARRGPAGG